MQGMDYPLESPFKDGTLKHACFTILAEAGEEGARVRDIVRRIQERKLAHLAGSTPANTICSALSSVASMFVRIAPGMYALAAFTANRDMDYQEVGSRKRAHHEANIDDTPETPAKPTKSARKGTKGSPASVPLETPSDEKWDLSSPSPKGGFRGAGTSISQPATPSPMPTHRRNPESVGRSEGLSQRDACIRVLQDAGPEGMSVNEVVAQIKRHRLARLVGRTPHNSITRCLSADEHFMRIKPGRYALHDTRMAMCAEVLSLFSGGMSGPPPV
eukprot:CAMPEP_0118939968 /NCGR_PEP_ID=MMETSP1169-20130426/30307_1 /TAXON_ID=36882 /ORGANISM="Pyramimonas obovata, Strain CCMP722" /LENGTH=273 /DNA_ID=CAMNT_0006884357 /DNA_START=190 /DNA_END=1007 /DNA_ORIENTATION=-